MTRTIDHRNLVIGLGGILSAAAIYTAFAVCLYYPYFSRFTTFRYLILANAVVASLGCFLLSRRWVSTGIASLFAGIVYGFGPFALGLDRFHVTAGAISAATPWLFLPAAFWPQTALARDSRWPAVRLIISAVLSAVPFVAIILAFWLAGLPGLRLFPLPIQAKLHLADMAGLLSPLGGSYTLSTIGFYHVPLAALAMGLVIFFKARRYGIAVIFAVGAVLSCRNAVFDVSPLIWAAIPVLCCSILIGIGIQSLAWAGDADGTWVLICAGVAAFCAVAASLIALAGSRGFFHAAKMYLLALLLVLFIFFTSRAGLRLRWLRWLFVCAAFGIDIFLGAQMIVAEFF